MKDSFIQFIKFGIVGLSNTVIGYGIYVVSLYIFRRFGLFNNIDIYVAQFVMFVLSVLWSFYWNKKKVFIKSKESIFNSLVKTYITYGFTTFLLSEVLLVLWVRVFNINEYIAPLLSLIITVPLNFIIQKFWVFRDIKESKSELSN